MQKLFKTGSIVIALLVGTLVSASMGRFDWKSVADSAWFSFPQRTMLHWGISFNLTSILTFIIIYAILTTETTGTWFAMGAVTNHKITSRQWNHGIIGEGLSCLVAALAGTTPVTGYSTNAGVISITGEFDLYIIGLPIILTLALVLLPSKVTNAAPQMIQYLLGSPIAIAAITAIVLNLLMPSRHNKLA